MPTFFFSLTTLTQVFDDETAIAEALNFAEISRFDSNDERRDLAIRANVEEMLKHVDAREIATRIAPETVVTAEVKLEIEPPRNTEFWRAPISIRFQFAQWQRADGYRLAFVPSLSLLILTKDGDDFAARVEREIRAALVRENYTKSLEKLRLLERARRLEIARSEIAVELKTLKQRELDEERDDEEKSIFDSVATKLNEADLPRAYELETTVELLAETLVAPQKISVLLIGANGVGKTGAVYELARQREKFGLGDRNFYATSGARLIAGQTGFGQWQERCQKLVEEAREQNAIVHFGNLVELLEVGKSNFSAQGIASFFRPKFQRGELQAIVECTPEQLAIIEKQDANLLQAFQQIRVEEPSRETGLRILRQVANEFAAPKSDADKQNSANVVRAVDALHRRYAGYSAFPGRPVRFLRDLMAMTDGAAITEQTVLTKFARQTGLPLFLLDDREKLDSSKIEQHFNRRVLGQPDAVRLVADLIATIKARLTRPRKPVASLLFIGATGVGKTELTRALAEFFFGNRERMIRFDMSEFATPVAVQRLIGGFGAIEGQLTARVREQPFSVLLFDEFEKADASFFDLLLQILGDGRLTDGGGRTADFTNAIIVMTSNLGAETFGRGASGFVQSKTEKTGAIQHFNQAVRDFLRPEIFNRIDRVVPFAPLDKATAARITDLEIEKLLKRDGLRFRQIKFEIAPEALNYLTEKGYDARYGARPLRRSIERELVAPLAAELNQRSVEEKLEVRADLVDDKIEFEIQSDANQKKARIARAALVTTATRAAKLRRNSQKLESSHHLIELGDGRFRLEQILQRRERSKWISPEDASSLERLPQIKNYLQSSADFAADVARLEDRILLDVYGQKDVSQADFDDELTINELRLEKMLLDLLRLKIEKPDEICLSIHGENAASLFRLIRAFLQCAEDFGLEVAEVYRLTTIAVEAAELMPRELYGRRVYSAFVAEPEKFFAKTHDDTLCVQLRIVGAFANPRFAPESGVNYFIHNNITNRVAVSAGDFPIKNTLPSETFAARGSLDDSFFRRRNYNADTKIIEDKTLTKKFDFDGRNIAHVINQAIDEQLQRAARNLIADEN